MLEAHKLLLYSSKVLKVLSLFLGYYALSYISIYTYLFFVKLTTAIFYFVIQRPLSSTERISKNDLIRLVKYAICSTILDLSYVYGLYLTGPLRTILLAEHNETVMTNLFSVLLGFESTISKSRGAIFFMLGVFSITFLDHDLLMPIGHPEGQHKSNFIHHFYEFFMNFGLSDHKFGALLLFLTVLGRVLLSYTFRTLSLNIGGSKRLNALATIISSTCLAPLYILNASLNLFSNASQSSVISLSMLAAIGIILVFEYYMTSMAINKCGQADTSFHSFLIFTISGILFTLLWPFETMLHDQGAVESDGSHPRHTHIISTGLIFSLLSLQYASKLLSASSRQAGGISRPISNGFLGINSPGFSHSSYSLSWHIKHTFQTIMKETASKKIFAFLCLNLLFTFVELAYGVWTNSLGLISDGFHMFFDCAALVMGLYASVIGQWHPDRRFSYGYHRAEVLSGFINSLFLVIISASIFLNAITRIFSPPEIITDRLLFISIAGLCVNLVGIFALGHAHSHGGKPCHGHNHDKDDSGSHHEHSHAHGHSHADRGEEVDEANLRGVYLHVLADTLGSVGVIASSFLVTTYGWNIADPICSLFIAIIIFASTIPLLQQTSKILVLSAPRNTLGTVSEVVTKILGISEVYKVINPQIWYQTADTICCNLRLCIENDVPEARILDQAKRLLTSFGFGHLNIQIEKEETLSSLLNDSGKLSLMPAVIYTKDLQSGKIQQQIYPFTQQPRNPFTYSFEACCP